MSLEKLKTELKKCISKITHRELENNPEVKKKISLLKRTLEHIEEYQNQMNEYHVNRSMLSYLDSRTFNSTLI